MVKYVRYDGKASSYLVLIVDEWENPRTNRILTIRFQYAFDRGVVVALPNHLFCLLEQSGYVNPLALTEVESP